LENKKYSESRSSRKARGGLWQKEKRHRIKTREGRWGYYEFFPTSERRKTEKKPIGPMCRLGETSSARNDIARSGTKKKENRKP